MQTKMSSQNRGGAVHPKTTVPKASLAASPSPPSPVALPESVSRTGQCSGTREGPEQQPCLRTPGCQVPWRRRVELEDGGEAAHKGPRCILRGRGEAPGPQRAGWVAGGTEDGTSRSWTRLGWDVPWRPQRISGRLNHLPLVCRQSEGGLN